MSPSALAETSLALRVEAEQIASSVLPNGGRAPVIADPDKVQLFLAALADGNYREVALKIAGIAKQTYYNTLKRAEAGDLPAQSFIDACEKAEAEAEAHMVRNVRRASELPQYWAAAATHLERKHPDRWGRRQDDQSAPKVIVQIGARDSDVQVQINTTFASETSAVSLCKPELTGDLESDNQRYGALSNPVPAVTGQVIEPVTAREPAEGPTGVGAYSSAEEVAERKGRVGGGAKKKGGRERAGVGVVSGEASGAVQRGAEAESGVAVSGEGAD